MKIPIFEDFLYPFLLQQKEKDSTLTQEFKSNIKQGNKQACLH